MPKVRKSHPPSLKAKVAVEAIRAHKTAAQIAQMFGVHPTQVGGWKKQASRRERGSICLAALTIAAEGGKADIAKPMRGIGAGVFEIALPFKGDAFRVVYAVQLADDIWVVHAFQKRSTQGIKTPKHEIDLIKDRLKRLKEKCSTYSGFRPNGSAVGELLRSADPPEGRGTTQFIQPYRARSCLFPEERVS